MRTTRIDSKTRRSNILLGIVLAVLTVVLVGLALFYVNPDFIKGQDSLLTR